MFPLQRSSQRRNTVCGLFVMKTKIRRSGAGLKGVFLLSVLRTADMRDVTTSVGPIAFPTSFLRPNGLKIQRLKSQLLFCAFRFTEDGRNINFSRGWNGENRGALEHKNYSDVPPVRTKKQLIARTHQPNEANDLPDDIDSKPSPRCRRSASFSRISITVNKGESHESPDGYHIPRPTW